jgi:hypothetical protein
MTGRMVDRANVMPFTIVLSFCCDAAGGTSTDHRWSGGSLATEDAWEQS